MDVKSLPVRHVVEDENGHFRGIALMTPDEFRQFLRDQKVDRVALKIVTDKDSQRACRTPLDPLCLPYFTMEYKEHFLGFHESCKIPQSAPIPRADPGRTIGHYSLPYGHRDKMIESCAHLEDFTSLNPIEELFSQDRVEEVKELEMDFPPRFSEICVKFGAWKCFEYMVEKDLQNGHQPGTVGSCISWKVNLYLIRQGKNPLPYIHHPAELCFVLYYDRKDMLPLIELPSIEIAFKTMMKFIRENSFDSSDYVREIYDMYPVSRWRTLIATRSSKTITFLLQVGKHYLLQGIKISSGTVKEVLLNAPDKLETLRELCVFPVVCKSDDPEVLCKMREYGLYACRYKCRARSRVSRGYSK